MQIKISKLFSVFFNILLAGILMTGTLSAEGFDNGAPTYTKSELDMNYFNVKMVFNNPVLYWSLNNKVRDDIFLVEKSLDGRDYVVLGEVKGTKQSNYSFVDDNPDKNINYYRFKLIHKDSSVTIGPVKVIVLQDNSPYVITPCLVKKWITVHNVEESYKESVIHIINANSGEVVYQTTLLSMNKSMQVNLSILPSGDYVAKIHNGSRVFYHSFLKQ